ncbi:MAG: type I DNA topoisomerase, partial [Dehalococcoidia bacterium]
MAKELVIVESPAKARTLGKILGSKYEVMASMGHVRDLPPYRFGVKVAQDFSPTYEVLKEKKAVVQQMAQAAKKASTVYLATDPDREGEAISWHLVQASKMQNVSIKRVVFHEITEKAIKSAFKNPRDIDMDLVNAQQARRILDRLVGYRLSPLLWRKIQRGLSAGRVQSVALRMIADREQDIRSFDPKEYWTIEAQLKKQGRGTQAQFKAVLSGYKGSRKKLAIPDQQECQRIAADLDGAAYAVAKVQKKELRRHPSPPFTTSTLQQEAWRKLRYTAKRTMIIAQQLYEGLSLGPEGQVGLITYMRTDSTTVSAEARSEVRRYIGGKFGAQFVPPSPRVFTRKARGAQEAHEAIRPTRVEREPEAIRGHLSPEQRRLYELIWKRMVASQMSNAVIDSTSVTIDAESPRSDNTYLFKARGSVVTFPGFLVLYSEGEDEKSDEDGQGAMPDLSSGDGLNCQRLDQLQHFTQPPPRYTEASLIKAMEEYGIGRPSTYAPILSTIQDRKYVSREQGRFLPTELGSGVNRLLTQHFPDIVDLGFTAEMEEELDEVARGERGWVPLVRDFYGPFQEAIARAAEEIPDEATGMTCELCGRPMVVRAGRRGRFIACTGYPECKNTKSIPKEEKESQEPEELDEACDKCGRPLVVRTGRTGKFIGCSGYPECKNTKPYLIKTGARCPDCGSDLVEKRSKKGRTFYGCANYPTCNFAVGQRPLSDPCPSCDGLMVVSGRDGARCLKCKARHRLGEAPAEE